MRLWIRRVWLLLRRLADFALRPCFGRNAEGDALGRRAYYLEGNMKRLMMLAMMAIISGCVTEYTGSRTVVGEQTALPEISDASDSLAVRVYESVKGAKVWTAKDCRVTINYSNAYTNTYFGIVETQDAMRLDVTIEPLDISTAQPK